MGKLNKILLVSAFILSGCGLYTTVDVEEPTVNVVVNTDLASKIKDSLKNAPKEDCIKIYKFFAGLSSYLKNITDDNLDTNKVLNETLLKVQHQYVWNRDTYPAFTTIISDDIVSYHLDDPHKLGDVNDAGKKYKDIMIERFDEYSAIIKSVIESK